MISRIRQRVLSLNSALTRGSQLAELASLSRRGFAGALGLGVVAALTGMWSANQERRVAGVDFRIGGNIEDPEEYQFGEIRGVALLPDYRFVVADYKAPRVALYAADGQFISEIGGVGEGPGEFRQPGVVAVDPGGLLWVYNVRGQGGYFVFSLDASNPAYVRAVTLERYLEPRKPVFGSDGLVGLRGRVDRLHGERVWVDAEGIVVRVDSLPEHMSSDELGYRRFMFPGRGGEDFIGVMGPFAVRDWLADSPKGGYARSVTSHYQVDLYDVNGFRFRTIGREELGPAVSSREREREEFLLDSLRTAYRPGRYPRFTVPDRKPAIQYIWFRAGPLLGGAREMAI